MSFGGEKEVIGIIDKHSIIKLKTKGHSNRSVASLLGINRKTVARYWNEYVSSVKELENTCDDTKRVQEEITATPKYNSSTRKNRKYTEEIDAALDLILESEDEKLKRLGTNKQKLTVVQIHECLIEQGFDIGKSTISNKVREKRNYIKECYIRQSYDFADRLEYDFGEVKLYIDGKSQTYHIAVLSSPASDFRWAYLYKNQKKEVFMDSHVRFFEMIGGAYKEVVYDNMRNVVTRFLGKNEKQLNEDLLKLSIYYGFEINVTNAFSGNEKGHVEGSVKIIRNRIFGPKYKFSSFEEAEKYLQEELLTLNESSLIEDEKEHLLEYKPKLELANITSIKINTYGFARIENNFYSVPDYLVGKRITAKVYYDQIHFYSNHHLVCVHKKIDGSNETSIDIRHYLPTFEKKPGAVHNSFALKSIPRLKSIYDVYFKGKSREFVALLVKYKNHNLDEIADLIREELATDPSKANCVSSSEVISMTQNQLLLYNQLSIKEVH